MSSLRMSLVWCKIGWYDIKTRYRRTMIGPLWVTLSTSIMIGCLGFLYGSLFGLDLKQFFPYISSGLIVWTLLASIITEGSIGFISLKHIILNLIVLPRNIIYRIVFRSFVVFLHNLVVFLAVAYFCNVPITIYTLFFPVGVIIVLLNGVWISTILGYLSARFGDVPQIVNALVSVLFLGTPIFWYPELLKDRAYFATLNPFTHFIAIVREPLLGNMPSSVNLSVSVVITIVGLMSAMVVDRACRQKIPYWL